MHWIRKANAWRAAQRAVWKRDGYICQYCKTHCGDDPTVDHRVPKALGGDDRRDNLITACRRCNGDKADKDPLLFLSEKRPNSGKKHKRRENKADKAIRDAAMRRKQEARWRV